MSVQEAGRVKKLPVTGIGGFLTGRRNWQNPYTGMFNFIEKYGIIAAIILVWELLPRLDLIDTFLLPPFSDVLESWADLITSGEMFQHFSISMMRSITGFFVGIGIAIPLGVFMGWYKAFEEVADPLLQACRSSSTIALYPVFLLFFGIGEQAKIAIIIWGTIWPTLLSTTSGVQHSDPLLIKSARSMGVTGLKLLYKVIVPNAVPNMVTGIRLSASHALLVVVVAEMIGARAGMGFAIFNYEERYAVPEMYAMIVSLSLVGVMVNSLLNILEKRLTAWKEKTTGH